VGKVYETVAVPELIPVTRAEEEPMVAIAVLLLLQLPPVVVSLRVPVEPVQIVVVPVIGFGRGSIVTVERE
jgi:hypothetical protein